jgi:pyridoxamine 5'-phosphate oxidase
MNGLLEDPLAQFQLWYREAEAANPAPEAAALATATPDGRPSVRMVLVKRVDELGFGFHTNLESRKGLELAANPRAALLFHWRGGPGRQVRVEGGVERVPGAEAEEYFRTRPHGSRLAAWASPQSRPIADRAELERRYREAEERFAGGEIPLPPHWGGFRLVADAYEFWQQGEHRLHDRVRYERDGEGWRATRLAP